MRRSEQLVVEGVTPLRGTVRVPGDKGISHRGLLFASLAAGRSTITGLARGDDVAHTRAALAGLGVALSGSGSVVTIEGRGADGLREPDAVLDCGNSGSSIRMLSGLLAGRPFLSVLTGDASLRTRPMRRVVEPLRAMGARVDARADGTLPPLVMRGGELAGREHVLAVASAQVKTALVLAGLQASGTTLVREPAPSRDHTERMLGALGAPVSRVDPTTLRIEAGAPRAFELAVPGDPSSAAFWVVGATIVPGSDVVIEGVSLNPTRLAFVDVLRRMGATIDMAPSGEALGEPYGDLHVIAAPLHATMIAGDEMPFVQDEIPVLAIAAANAEGVTEIRDAGELRVKESDRIASVEDLVRALGATVESTADSLSIRGGPLRPAVLVDRRDHRIAMAGAIAALAIAGTCTVEGWAAASVSYPEFGDDLAMLTDRG